MKISQIHAYAKVHGGNIAVVECSQNSPTPFVMVKNLESLKENANTSWDFAFNYWPTLEGAMSQFNHWLGKLTNGVIKDDPIVEEFLAGTTYQISAEEAAKTLIRDEIYAHDISVAHKDVNNLVDQIYQKIIQSEEGTIFSSDHFETINKSIESYGLENNFSNTLFL